MFRAVIWLVIVAVASVGLVFVFNSDDLANANRTKVVVTPDTFAGTKSIELESVVEVTGTPDLLNAVSLEEKEGSRKVVAYYVPLKEYGTNFVVKIKTSQLKSESQTFTGVAVGINHTQFDRRIKNRLNKPVELSETDRLELDPETIDLLQDETTKDFPNTALIILDGEIPDSQAVYGRIIFWSIVSFVALSTLLRHYVFKDILF